MGRKAQNAIKSISTLKWRAGLYIRLSKEDQDGQFSVENQKKRLSDFVDAHEEEFESIRFYIDSGASGSNSDRKAFSELLQGLRNSDINCVIVKDLSRLSRNYYEAGYYLEHLFVTLNVRFISLEYPALDSYTSPDFLSNIMVPIQNIVNDDFCRQTSVKVKNVLRMKMEKGEFIGACAPYGYIKCPTDRHRLIVDEEAAHIVRKIFHWFTVDNMSQNGIVHRLNELGIPTPLQRKQILGLKQYNPHTDGKSSALWSIRTVRMILTKETYIGNLVQGKAGTQSYRHPVIVEKPKEAWVTVENTHPAIVSHDVFRKAQELLSRNTRAVDETKPLTLFAGFTRCSDCRRGLARTSSRGYTYYSCRTQGLLKNACTKHTISEQNLTNTVDAAICLLAKMSVDRKNVISEISGSYRTLVSNQWQQLVEKKLLEIDRINHWIKSLYPDWKNGDITKTEYHVYRNDYENDIQRLQTEIQTIETEAASEKEQAQTNDTDFQNYVDTGELPDLNRNAVSTFIDIISVGGNDELTIQFKCRDPFVDAVTTQ